MPPLPPLEFLPCTKNIPAELLSASRSSGRYLTQVQTSNVASPPLQRAFPDVSKKQHNANDHVLDIFADDPRTTYSGDSHNQPEHPNTAPLPATPPPHHLNPAATTFTPTPLPRSTEPADLITLSSSSSSTTASHSNVHNGITASLDAHLKALLDLMIAYQNLLKDYGDMAHELGTISATARSEVAEAVERQIDDLIIKRTARGYPGSGEGLVRLGRDLRKVIEGFKSEQLALV